MNKRFCLDARVSGVRTIGERALISSVVTEKLQVPGLSQPSGSTLISRPENLSSGSGLFDEREPMGRDHPDVVSPALRDTSSANPVALEHKPARSPGISTWVYVGQSALSTAVFISSAVSPITQQDSSFTCQFISFILSGWRQKKAIAIICYEMNAGHNSSR